MRKHIVFCLWILCAFFILIQACRPEYFRNNYTKENSQLYETTSTRTRIYLKAHLKNGDVCILKNSWTVDSTSNMLTGYGVRYDFNRSKSNPDSISISLDSVALFETNRKLLKGESGRATALSVLAGVNIAISLYCFANPKACFGSCPTFYTDNKKGIHYADAEGFSSAVLPSLEYADIDALNMFYVQDDNFSLTMKNEALETHCVKDVRLIAFPVEKGERVYQTPFNEFYLSNKNYELSGAFAREGNVTQLLESGDKIERHSTADETGLNSKEEIILNFENLQAGEKRGLLLRFRQSLMTTYLFYSAMGYMGDQASDFFALLETQPSLRKRFDATIKLLGDISVEMWDESSHEWIPQSGFNETGPIAINQQVLPLTVTNGNSAKIRLKLNKGFWRIDHAAIVNLVREVNPEIISPTLILNKGKEDKDALQKIHDPENYLISMPGNEFKFYFNLLPGRNYDLFLYSKGYYLEWMREQWIKEKNMTKLRQMVFEPEVYLKNEAKNYKLYESTMEETFWNSKIDTQTFSFYEN